MTGLSLGETPRIANESDNVLGNRFERLLAIWVCWLLLRSSFAHLGNPYFFLDTLLQYKIGPASWNLVVAAMIPLFQLSIAAALILQLTTRVAWLCSLFMFSGFVCLQIRVMIRGDTIPCGCFRAVDHQNIGWQSLAIAGSGWMCSFLGFMRTPPPQRSVDVSDPTISRRHRQGYTVLEILLVIAIIALLIGLILPAVQKVRASAARLACQNHLKQLALGLHGYHGSNHKLPPGLTVKMDGGNYRYASWLTRELPWIEQEPLWREAVDAFGTEANVDPWRFFDHRPHRRIGATPIPIMNCPADGRLPGPNRANGILLAHTSYCGNAGLDHTLNKGLFSRDSDVRFSEILDGTSQTLCIGERPPPSDFTLGWWYRGWGQDQGGSAETILGVREINIRNTECDPGPHQFTLGQVDRICDAFHFWSLHSGGANFAFADGSVRFLRYSANDILPALATRAGGESTSVPD